MHPELFDGLPNLKEVIFVSPQICKKIDSRNIWNLKEELKPLFDNYNEKYGKKAVEVPVPNWQQKFEKLQIELQTKNQKYEILLKIYNQSKQELQEFQTKFENMKRTPIKTETTEDPPIGKVSSELLKNYEKLKDIDGDIILEFSDGKILKAHKAVLIGEFRKPIFPNFHLSQFKSIFSSQLTV
jgi:hypothetical protein